MCRQCPCRHERKAVRLSTTTDQCREGIDVIEQFLLRCAFATRDAIERRQRELGASPDDHEVIRIGRRTGKQALRRLTERRVGYNHHRRVDTVCEPHREITDCEICEHHATERRHRAGRNYVYDFRARASRSGRCRGNVTDGAGTACHTVRKRPDHARRNAAGQAPVRNSA